MPTSLSDCAALLRQDGVLHHVDDERGTIHVLLFTERYANCRAEKVAVVGIQAPEDGYRVRVAIEAAFAVERDPAAACLVACELAAATPLVAAEYDVRRGTVALVAEVPVEDGSLTRLQLLSMVDRVVAAAEAWHEAIAGAGGAGRAARGRTLRSPRRRSA